jgi:hypothetical protein
LPQQFQLDDLLNGSVVLDFSRIRRDGASHVGDAEADQRWVVDELEGKMIKIGAKVVS